MKKIDDTATNDTPYFITNKDGMITHVIKKSSDGRYWILDNAKPNSYHYSEYYKDFDDAFLNAKKFRFKRFLDENFGLMMFGFIAFTLIPMVIFAGVNGCK